MAFDDASTRNDQTRRIETETAQRPGGLAYEHALIPTRGPGHVTEPFDRMHHSRRYCHIGGRRHWGVFGLARYRLQPWRATRPSIQP